MYDNRELVDFLANNRCNAWIMYGPMQAYIRVGYHVAMGRPSRTFDIANVNIDDPVLRNKGTFQAFVREVERLLRIDALRGEIEGIYVENVYPPELRDKLKRMGLEAVKSLGDMAGCQSYYTPLPMPFGAKS